MAAFWCEELRGVSCVEVAAAFGMTVRRKALSKCPACQSAADGAGKLYRDRAGRERWRCFRCDVGGDALDLVSWVLFGERLRELSRDQQWEVRSWFVAKGHLNDVVERSTCPPTPRSLTPPTRPSEVARRLAPLEVLDRCLPVTADPEVRAFLEHRGLDPLAVKAEQLALALPAHAPVPRSLVVRGRAWTQGWRCLLRTYDETGRLASLRGRWVRGQPPARGLPKAVAAALGPGSSKGAVMANAAAQKLLRQGAQASAPVVVVEGETDFLTWASLRPELPVIGIWAGAWTPGLAARVPDGATVVIRTDNDAAGDRYAQAVHGTLHPRCRILRKEPRDVS